ncbi:MAG: ABC transporter ATP-binding protein [Methanoregula sp.]
MSDVVIRVENLYKEYRLGTIGQGYLFRDIQSGWAKIRGTKDPNARIGSVNREQLNSTNARFCALKEVSFDVRQGEVVGIIGRNGAGKSTLLKIISRVTAPTSGTIKIKGRVASLLEVGTGFHPELTGRENIFLNGAILGMHKGEIEQKFDEIVRFAEIDKFIDTPVKRYSSGMYVRLAFAVAAHLEPEILVVDEVLAVGDVAFQKKCLGKMEEVAKEGRTVLFVSHNMTAVKALCSRGIVIEDGQIIFDGDTSKAVDFYLGSKRLSEDRSIPVAERKREHGCSLRAKIVDITVISDGQRNPKIIDPFKPLIIQMKVESGIDLRCAAEIRISDEMQSICLFDSGYIHGQDIFVKPGMNIIECRINPLKLYSGNYLIYCGLVIHGTEVIDRVENAYSFSIDECDPNKTGFNIQKGGNGFFYVDHEWKCP